MKKKALTHYKFPSYESLLNFCYENFSLSFSIEKSDFLSLTKNIKKTKVDFHSYFEDIETLSPKFFTWKNWSFPVFIEPPNENYMKDEKLDFDVFVNAFFLLSGWQEWISTETDAHDRFPYKNSLQYKYDFVTTPTVTIYFELIFELCQRLNIPVERKRFDSPLIFTHDIDQLRSGWLEDIRYELSNFKLTSPFHIAKSIAIKIFGLKDSYYLAFEKMASLDNDNDIKAISFFMTEKSHKDADHEINEKVFLDLLKGYEAIGEIGIHPGYETCSNNSNFKKQKIQLENLIGFSISKSRQHFLKYNVKTTPHILEQSGIKQDYTLGFTEMYGFRNSIATPFYLYDFENGKKFDTLEIPLFFMDSTLIDYLKLNDEIQRNKIVKLIELLNIDFNCNFSVLFHNTAFSEKRYKGFTKMYLRLIEIAKK